MSPIKNKNVKELKWFKCGRKFPHQTFQSAVKALFSKMHVGDLGVHIYRCDVGKHWHLGHSFDTGFCNRIPKIARSYDNDYAI
jgi:hypothetical protein